MPIDFYAHTKTDPETETKLNKAYWQPLKQHLLNVADLAAQFAAVFNGADLADLLGRYHDLGKYSREFQERLQGRPAKVDHSTAGGYELRQNQQLGPVGAMIAYAVLGHHGGLPDTGASSEPGSLKCRLNPENLARLPDYHGFAAELDLCNTGKSFNMDSLPQLKNANPQNLPFSMAFLVRMLFSCLVDADWLDTEAFMSDNAVERGGFDDINALYAKFEAYMTSFGASDNELNIRRSQIMQRCLAIAKKQPGFFTLTVPTGGGKTLSSLGFALKHAKQNHLKRIIYTIPYTSIIEQNAAVFRAVLGPDNVLEHHSNYQFETKDIDENADNPDNRLKLAAQNWDAPLIATTNVQFFESLFANKPAQCRKLHNIAGSVIILDEAQMLPVDYLSPCVHALEELVRFYNCTVVLCSATQPALDKYFSPDLTPEEIMENPAFLEQEPVFKRVNVTYVGSKADTELADTLIIHPRALVIVNTKRHAKELYHALKNTGVENLYHLSTLMCPAHRKQKLAEVKKLLNDADKPPVLVVSTQLIEAGVDVDFPVVYRSAAGIDSIVQSAGRCNRNSQLTEGRVLVFQSAENYGKPKGYLQRTAQIGESIAEKYPDVISAAAVEEYFGRLYTLEQGDKKHLDTNNIMDCFRFGRQEIFNFKTCAHDFRLIEDNTQSIIIPFDETAMGLIEEFRHAKFAAKILRRLQPYTVNVFQHDFAVLLSQGALETLDDSIVLLRDMCCYNDGEGLMIDKEARAMFV